MESSLIDVLAWATRFCRVLVSAKSLHPPQMKHEGLY